ncbi:MAG TPA: multidrug resistance efflux transporter family protein [Bacillota bacterium]|nr:multidrug resistance efflux transporter family protein [Bacillota bacterium]
MRPIILGICAAFFFAFTFILNRMIELSGGSWIWSASLRYIFMVPFLLLLVTSRKNLGLLLKEMKINPSGWLLWSMVGFGLFYAPLCFAAAYGPGWLIAGTWQITIVSGTLLVPFFYETIQTTKGPIRKRRTIPTKGLAWSSFILLGIALMQFEQAHQLTFKDVWFVVLPVLIASFAYPLGNRKMMELCAGRLDAYQRVLGMTLASLPFWLILSIYGITTAGFPSQGQMVQSLLVAICSGVIATVLFFRSTDMASGNMQKLAAIEATQSMEVLFTVLGEWLLGSPIPSGLSWMGMFLVILGMVSHSLKDKFSIRA